MDYRKFLTADESMVLPYTGGLFVEAENRRLRVAGQRAGQRADEPDGQGDGELTPGWWTFVVKGRKAEAREPAFAPDSFYDRPSVRGHAVGEWLFVSGREVECMAFMPEEELEPLAPCRARRWYTGELIFDCTEFEEEAEEQARLALEEMKPVADIKGIGASLRAAYGHALTEALSQTLEIPVSPREVQWHIMDIADRGREAAEALLRRIDEERRAHEAERQARIARATMERQVREAEVRAARDREQHRARMRHQREQFRERCAEALAGSGAQILRARRLGTGQVEVTFRFRGQRFICIVQADTLGVHDAGICLDGADRELTLDSLPSAIREAIDTHQLVITRR